MAFKLFAYCPFEEDATSWYRGMGPLGRLRSDSLDIVTPNKRVAWPNIEMCDALFMQRPFLPENVALANLAKSHKKPIWIDFDDNLFCVPKDNPTNANYDRPEIKENVKTISKMADVVSVSTERLAEAIRPYNQNVHVIPNALNMKIHHKISSDIPPRPVVVWRGSHTHFADVHEHTDQILEAYTKHPDWSWVFFGWNPTWITKYMDETRHRHVQFDNLFINYIHNLQRMRAAIHIVPLVDNEFNRCKSNVSHLEASLAGSTVLAPNWEEWQGGVIERYTDKKDFGEKLLGMLAKTPEELNKVNVKDWEWVLENRTLEKTNKLRAGMVAMLQGFC